MGKIEEFKEFVKKNPKLLKYVNSGESNWQKFYETYDLYGESQEAWKDFLTPTVKATAAAAGAIGFADVLSWFKGLNLDNVQSGIGNIQRVLGVVGDFTSKDAQKPTEEYKPRPMYKHFED